METHIDKCFQNMVETGSIRLLKQGKYIIYNAYISVKKDDVTNI